MDDCPCVSLRFSRINVSLSLSGCHHSTLLLLLLPLLWWLTDVAMMLCGCWYVVSFTGLTASRSRPSPSRTPAAPDHRSPSTTCRTYVYTYRDVVACAVSVYSSCCSRAITHHHCARCLRSWLAQAGNESVPRNVRRILVRGVNPPLPPEAKKILKIWLRNGAFWSISE